MLNASGLSIPSFVLLVFQPLEAASKKSLVTGIAVAARSFR